jgi:predicted ATPase/DNA-binding CsgD family transcriptional regulator
MDTIHLTATLDLEPHFVLPDWRAAMIGRESERKLIQDLLDRPDVWLVTITGPGGVGKTRLAHAVARSLQVAFDNAVAWVSLASATSAELGIETLARSLGVVSTGIEPERAIARALEGRRALLVLDNLEQVPEFAPFVAGLARENPQLAFLATSRKPLRLGGERDVALSPFPAPRPRPDEQIRASDLAGNSAVELFVERAQAVDQSFALTDANAAAVAEICSRLDGLPLAIELAAARVRLLPPEAMVPRLARSLDLLVTGPRDAPFRQQTLRNAIRWSYDLLSPDEQQLFRRLSVFSGGFGLEAAQAISETGAETLDLVSRLLDHSLLLRLDRPGDPRFAFLDTIRAFAADMLAGQQELGTVRDRHAGYFASLIAHPPGVSTVEDRDWLDLVDLEIGNIREALSWLETRGDPEHFLALCNSMSDWWKTRGTVSEGRAWFVKAIQDIDAVPAVTRFEGLLYSSWLASLSGDLASARKEFDQIRADELSEAGARLQVRYEIAAGAHAFNEGDLHTASTHMQRAYDLAETAGLLPEFPGIRMNLGVLAFAMDDWSEARSHFELGVSETATPGVRALQQISLADLDLKAGDLTNAARHLAEAWPVVLDLGHTLSIVASIPTCSEFLLQTGDAKLAMELLAAADQLRSRIGWATGSHGEAEYAGLIEAGKSALGEEQFAAAMALGRTLTVEDIDARIRSALSMREAGTGQLQRDGLGADTRGLTARELDVLRLLIDGKTNPEIAADLFISERTVQTHVARILQKLGVPSRTAAATLAIRDGILR